MTKRVVVYVFDRALRVLHPYMPFVTENLWQHIPKEGESLMLADWPLMEGEVLEKGEEAVKKFELFQALVRSIRNARAEYNVDQGKKIPADFVVAEGMVELVGGEMASIVLLCRMDADDIRLHGAGSDEAKALERGEGNVRLVAEGGSEVYIARGGLIDKEKELARLKKADKKLEKEIEKLEKRLNGKGFADKAPKAVVDKARDELRELVEQKGKIEESLHELV